MIQLYQHLDLRPIGIPQTLRLSQYDSDFEIIFELTNFDGAWILDTNTTAEVQGTKTDGHGYSADAVFDDQLKTVTIAGDVQMTAAAGRNTFEVVLFHDGDRLGSKNFILDVERAALDAETTASDSKIKNFTEMTEAAEDAAETATAAAEAAEDAAEAAETAAAAFTTDTTLSISGKAADAQVTGDALAKNTAVDVASAKKILQEYTWESGSISSSTGSKSSSTTRIRTNATISGTCDALLVSCPANMKIVAYSYLRAIASSGFVGSLTGGFVTPDKNGYVLIPVTKGLAYAFVAAYQDDSTISAEAASGISVYKCFYPHGESVQESEKAFLSHSITLYGKDYMWQSGGYSEATGIKASNEYTIRTDDYIAILPKSKLTFTGVTLTSCFVYFYDANHGYLYRKSLLDGPVTAPDTAAYMNLMYGNTTASGIKVTDGIDLVNNYKLSIVVDQLQYYLDKFGYMPFEVKKGYWAYNGTIKTNTTAICTSELMQLEVGTQIKVVISEPDWYYSTMQGESATSLSFNDRLVNYDSFTVNHPYVGIMFYKSDGQGGYVNLTADDFDGQITLFKSGYTTSRENEIHDVPENIGVLNVINRAYQMAKLTYAPVANLPTQVNTEAFPHYIPAGTIIEGVMYSSVRNEGLYVPQCVSLQTYMTALKNPHSYIYTKTEPEPHYNALTFYGAVCSSMVGWCYGIDDVIPTTVSFDTYDGMEVIENQSPYGLKLGDMLNKSDAHIVIITDIIRNNRGVIKGIEVSEQVNSSSHPYTRHRTLKPDYIQSYYFDGGYVAYRYHYIYKVPYTPSPWVNLDDEASEPAWNLNLSPRRGEDANWRVGENIEIDVTDAENYTNAKLYKGETLVQTDAIPQDDLLVYSDLAYGSYSVCLTDGSEDSESVRFDIIDASVLYTALGDGTVRAAYSSANGTPASVSFCEARQNDSDYKATRAFHVLTDEEISAGEVVLEAPSTGNWLMKTQFKTQFGLYSSDLTEVSVT